jgi:hypothetical protein
VSPVGKKKKSPLYFKEYLDFFFGIPGFVFIYITIYRATPNTILPNKTWEALSWVVLRFKSVDQKCMHLLLISSVLHFALILSPLFGRANNVLLEAYRLRCIKTW